MTQLANTVWAEGRHILPCNHVENGINKEKCLATIRKPDAWCCEACDTSNAIRLCLHCGSCACERHSYRHNDNALSHALFLQLNHEQKPVYCYSCRAMVHNDNAIEDLKEIRAVLEAVQSLNLAVTSKTTRSGRKRLDPAVAAAAATTTATAVRTPASAESGAAEPASQPSAPSSPTSPPSPPDALSSPKNSMWEKVKGWRKCLPYLSKKAQSSREEEDVKKTINYRQRRRILKEMMIAWKTIAVAGRETRKGMTRSSKRKASSVTLDDLSMPSLDLSKDEEGEEEEDEDEVMEDEEDAESPVKQTPAKRRRMHEAGSVSERKPARAEVQRHRRAKRSRSEERHLPVSPARARSSSRPPASSDDLLSPPVTRSRHAAPPSSIRASPKPRPMQGRPSAASKAASSKASAIRLAPGIMGLRNLGNTCYMNSCLQALSLTGVFREYYAHVVPKLLPVTVKHSEKSRLNSRAAKRVGRKKSNSDSSSPTGHDDDDDDESTSDDEDEEEDHSSLTRDLAEMMAIMAKGKRIQYTPDHLLQTVWTLYDRFKGFKQQDAQEFILFVLNQLSKEQESQLADQQLDPEFQNPALERAKRKAIQELEKEKEKKMRNKTSSTASDRNNRRKRKKDEPDENTEHEPVRPRRSTRASTAISTTSTHSLYCSTHHNNNPDPDTKTPMKPYGNPTLAQSPNGLASICLRGSPNTSPASTPPSSPSSTSSSSSSSSRASKGGKHHRCSSSTPCFCIPRLVLSREHDFIVQQFAGVVRNEVRCLNCDHVSATENEFLGMISVQIPPKTFLDAIDDEIVENGLHVPNNNTTSQVTKVAHISSPALRAHSSSFVQSAVHGGSSASASATFLSVSRSLQHSKSDQVLQLPPASPSLDSITARNKYRHDETSVTLNKCLAFTFNQPEVIDGDNAYSCSGCKQKVKAQKYQVIQAVPPKFLIVHIGRTVYDTSNLVTKKDQTHISFPLTDLDLSPYLPPHTSGSYSYDLYSVVTHHGHGLNEGHFTCFGYEDNHDCWLHFNDARVNVVTPEKVQEAQAYLLFYRRKETKKPSMSTQQTKLEPPN